MHGFKSLRDVRLELKPGVNVVVGPNASGKSNIVDLFLFLRRALFDELGRTPYAPHLPWGDPRNLTWEGSGAPIHIKIEYNLGGEAGHVYPKSKVIYEVVFGLEDGTTLRPIEEYIRVPGANAALLRRSRRIDIYIGRDWGKPERIASELRRVYAELGSENVDVRCEASGCYFGLIARSDFISILQLMLIPRPLLLFHRRLERFNILYSPQLDAPLPWPRVYNPCLELRTLLSHIRLFFARIVALRLIDYYSAKWPHRPGVRDRLEPNASNLAEVLYTLLRSPEKKAKIEDIVWSLFPWLHFSVEFDEYGNIVLKFYEDRGGRQLALHPSMVPEGVVKLLTIVTGILLEPSILAIDEIEDSMHARMIERLFDELRDIDIPVIVTTHSPVVVDLVDPERLIVLRRGRDGATMVDRIREPERLRKILEEEGVTLGYYYLHALPEET